MPLPSPFAFNLSQHQGLFQWVGSSHQVVKVLELQLQHQSLRWIFRVNFLWDWWVWSPWNPCSFQESSPAQFESINSLVLSLFYGPTLTSVHDYWKNHSFDYRKLCQQSDVSTSLYTKEPKTLPQWITELLPFHHFFFSFEDCHGWAESLELISGNEFTISPSCRLFWLKHLSFLLTLAPWIIGFWVASGQIRIW